jgi:hypothetical protein
MTDETREVTMRNAGVAATREPAAISGHGPC